LTVLPPFYIVPDTIMFEAAFSYRVIVALVLMTSLDADGMDDQGLQAREPEWR
jgi:hypothetical protein